MRANVPGFAILDPAEPTQLPLEARDFGIYVGFLVTWGYLIALGRGRAKGMPKPWMLVTMILFVGIMGFDGLNAFFYDLQVVPHLYEPRLELRLGTGLLCGIAFAGFLVPVVNFSLWRENDMRPIFENWKQFAGALALLVVLFVMNASELGIFYWPLAIITSASTVILIALINLVFVVSITGKDASAVTWRDALNPFAAGVILAMIELGLLSLLRYAVLGTTVLP
ncbi:MAG: DUF2085 domain-containing protein [Chloroflexi bacterium]|nr:DUF2085 domain-containing protein [Chloroflexota bacterium]